MPVYFIQENGNGLIKIGKSDDVSKRIKALQSSTPSKLNLLRVVNGSFDREKYLHHKFSRFHERGEWFRPDPELLKMIGEIEDDYSSEDCDISTVSFRIPVPVLQHAKQIADEIGYRFYTDLISDCFLEEHPME